ncbi:hypothetical protein HMPREF0490_01075 [Lachnospiraceae bacterium 6_1_37FAA]|nr:hypothetical protein HMPREF0490_01075 [Lachnospiraceae bacterium 6_1_37FAA]
MRYQIADCIVEYEPIYEFLKKKMESYRFDGDAKTQITLTMTEELCIQKQAEQSHLTLEECEYIFVGLEFYRKLLLQGGMMIHASAVEVDGRVYLFSADSGTGKSTHTKQWQKYFGTERALIINDDKPAVRKEADGWVAYGTPFSGKTDEQLNRKGKLQGICMLGRGKTNEIRRMEPQEAVLLLMRQTLVPRRQEMAERLLEMLDELFKEVPVYQMRCTISEDAAKMAYESMRGEGI